MRKYYLVYLLYCSTLLALPKGEKMAYGQVEFNKSSSSLQVNQKTKKAIIEWDSFSIGEKETVQFEQSSKDSAILNRVVGKDLSSIMGSLKANGRVYLLNENGILIGKTGRVDTRAFIASTLRIANKAFLEGKSIRFEGQSDASIINLGKISVEKDIYLFARTVENQGTLIAKDSVTLGSGQLLLKEGSQERVFVCPKRSDGSVTNTGRIEAPHVEMLCEGNLYSLYQS